MANVASFFKTMFEEAYRLVHAGQFVEADDILFRLLREPTLPLLYRAGSNLLLSFGDDQPVEFAQEAVKWYQEMYDQLREDPVDGPHHLALLEQAQDALENARRRVAAQDEASEDAEEDEEDAEDNDEDVDDDNGDAEDAVEHESMNSAAQEDSSTQ